MFLQNKKIIYFLLFIGLINALLIGFFYNDHFYRGDTADYVETAQWLGGDTAVEALPHRLLKPMGLIVPMIFEKAGVLGEYGLQFQNIIFYFLSIILLFDLIVILSGKKRQGFYATILFMTAWPFLTNALSYLTDMAGWFFYLLPVWLLVKLYKKEKLNLMVYFWLGALTGLGFLFKESAIAFLFFFIWVFDFC